MAECLPHVAERPGRIAECLRRMAECLPRMAEHLRRIAYGGECGIRTHGRFPYTRFPSVRLRPLGQLSAVLANGVAGSRAARNLAHALGNQTDQVPADDEQLRSQERSSVSRPIGRLYTGA